MSEGYFWKDWLNDLKLVPLTAKQTVRDLLDDLTGRRGFGWDMIDEEVQQEIMLTWIKIVQKHLNEDRR